jgi:hypothetical protein
MSPRPTRKRREKRALTYRISAFGRRREECRESGGRLL